MHSLKESRTGYAWVACIFVVAANLILGGFLYQTAGWYFFRGYNEVVNFVVVPLALAQACLNLVVAAPIVAIGRWRRSRVGRSLLAGLVVSATMVAISPLYAPSIGRFAARHLLIKTPLVEAARYGDARLVEILLVNGENPNEKQDGLGTTALHYMAYGDELSAVNALLASGADPNARAKTSLETPLHWAVNGRGSAAVVETLVKHGADSKLKDWKGKTPADYADLYEYGRRKEILPPMGWQHRAEIGETGHRPQGRHRVTGTSDPSAASKLPKE